MRFQCCLAQCCLEINIARCKQVVNTATNGVQSTASHRRKGVTIDATLPRHLPDILGNNRARGNVEKHLWGFPEFVSSLGTIEFEWVLLFYCIMTLAIIAD
jgi:hypothetical protein